MTESLRQNFLNLTVTILGAAVLALFGWIFVTSNSQAKLQTQVIQLQRERVNTKELSEKLSDARQNIRVLQVSVASLKEALENDRDRVQLNSERLAAHDAKDHHTGSGISQARMDQRLTSMYAMIQGNRQDFKDGLTAISSEYGRGQNQVLLDIANLRTVLSNLIGKTFTQPLSAKKNK